MLKVIIHLIEEAEVIEVLEEVEDETRQLCRKLGHIVTTCRFRFDRNFVSLTQSEYTSSYTITTYE